MNEIIIIEKFKGGFSFGKYQTFAFEQHSYELVSFPIPPDFLEDHLIRTMKNMGKLMFQVPTEHTTVNQELIIAFEMDEEFDIYDYKCVVAKKKILREYRSNETYWRV